MRIIAGELRSRHLVFPKSKKTRPMTDRMKETVFNILGDSVEGADVLDLFAGCGSFGLEALSRGARFATFVESGPWATKTLWTNVKRLGLEGKSLLVSKEVVRAIGGFECRRQNFTLIFLDPPYNKGLVKKILKRLDRSDIVSPLTQLILHHSRQEKLPEALECLKVLREKQIGQACLSFLSRKG